MTQSTRLWELSEEIRQLEDAIAQTVEDESLSEEARETKLEETFARWLETGASFKIKAEQVARYIRHQEALAEARKAVAGGFPPLRLLSKKREKPKLKGFVN